jgi:hypothetical protein
MYRYKPLEMETFEPLNLPPFDEAIPGGGAFSTIFRLFDKAKKLGYFKDYMLIGGMAVMNYTEPRPTDDTDFALNLTLEALGKLQEFLLANGGVLDRDGYVVIERIKCQLIPIEDSLFMQDALRHAERVTVAGVQIKVMKMEYIIARYLRLIQRPDRRLKDTQKLLLLLDQFHKVDEVLLDQVLLRYNLKDSYIEFRQRQGI